MENLRSLFASSETKLLCRYWNEKAGFIWRESESTCCCSTTFLFPEGHTFQRLLSDSCNCGTGSRDRFSNLWRGRGCGDSRSENHPYPTFCFFRQSKNWTVIIKAISRCLHVFMDCGSPSCQPVPLCSCPWRGSLFLSYSKTDFPF